MKKLAAGWAKFRASLVVQVAVLVVALAAGGAMIVAGVKPVEALDPPWCSPQDEGPWCRQICLTIWISGVPIPYDCEDQYFEIPPTITCTWTPEGTTCVVEGEDEEGPDDPIPH